VRAQLQGQPRRQTIDDEVTRGTLDYLSDANASAKRFLVWYDSTAMHHFPAREAGESRRTGGGFCAGARVEHDAHVGPLRDALDRLGHDEWWQCNSFYARPAEAVEFRRLIPLSSSIHNRLVVFSDAAGLAASHGRPVVAAIPVDDPPRRGDSLRLAPLDTGAPGLESVERMAVALLVA